MKQTQHQRNYNIGDNPMSDTTIIVLRAAGPYEIKLDWLIEQYAAFKKLARKLEERIRPALKKGQKILWDLRYHFDEDYPENERLPYPSIWCEVFIVNRNGKRSKPFEDILNLGRGPAIYTVSSHQFELDLDVIVEEAAKALLQ